MFAPRVALIALSGSLLLSYDADAQASSPGVITWDTSYVMLLEANPAYRPASEAATRSVVQAHQQYQIGLITSGRTIRGGPMVPAPGAALVGMTVFRAESAEEASAIAQADPGVKGGLFKVAVRTWTTATVTPAVRSNPRDGSSIEGM